MAKKRTHRRFAADLKAQVEKRLTLRAAEQERDHGDFEATLASATAFLYAPSVMLLTRELEVSHAFRCGRSTTTAQLMTRSPAHLDRV